MLFRETPGLLIAFREGREEALEHIYRTYVRSVERYLRALARATGTGELAQTSAIADLLQDVFVRAFSASARQGYDGERQFGAYLTTIARNCLVDLLRVRSREVLKEPGDLAFEIDDVAIQSETPCDPKISRVLTTFLADLPAVLRDICDQRFVLGRSQHQVSASLGISRREVRTAEKRLRKDLARALTQAGLSLDDFYSDSADFSTRFRATAVLKRSSR